MKGILRGNCMCIYVREITNKEGNQLKQILRRSKDSFKVKRAQVILASAQSMRVPELSKSFGFSSGYVSYVIHGFNEIGFKVFDSKYENCGSKPKFNNEQRQIVIDTALSKPIDLGLPFTEWSLPKLKDYIIDKTDIDYISHETIRKILREKGIRYRRTKTWKESKDPDFENKKTKS
jgi:transposase